LPADPSTANQESLSVQAASAGYGAGAVISDISLAVPAGWVVVLLGPNGSGKSTLLKAITGHIPLMSGRVLLQGADITNMRADRIARMGLGYVPQVRDAFVTMSVRENLEMGGYTLARSQVPERIERVVSIFPALGGLLDTVVSRLSGGERKMVAIARVLMLEPRALIIDEPTAGLSPKLSEDVLQNHVRRLADAKVAVLLVEQKAHEALRVADWAYVMVNGTMQMEGTPEDLLARQDIGIVFLGATPDDDLDSQPQGGAARMDGATNLVRVTREEVGSHNADTLEP
jgi:branched-chain amino acid transport system ATP-binding protein